MLQTTLNKLLPCPFCGDSAGIGTQDKHEPEWPHAFHFINCTSCGALMMPAHFNPDDRPPSLEEVIQLWNNRFP